MKELIEMLISKKADVWDIEIQDHNAWKEIQRLCSMKKHPYQFTLRNICPEREHVHINNTFSIIREPDPIGINGQKRFEIYNIKKKEVVFQSESVAETFLELEKLCKN